MIAKEILTGIEYLHSKGIIHRDLNPGNILVSEDFKIVKIIDFGVAKDLFQDTKDLYTFSPLGINDYRSPEMEFDKNYSFPHDLWTLGVVLLEIFNGKKVGFKKYLE